MKTKICTYHDKICTNFRVLNVPEDGVEYKSFYLFMKTSIICKYIETIVLTKLETQK